MKLKVFCNGQMEVLNVKRNWTFSELKQTIGSRYGVTDFRLRVFDAGMKVRRACVDAPADA